jgi:hypothetical protein
VTRYALRSNGDELSANLCAPREFSFLYNGVPRRNGTDGEGNCDKRLDVETPLPRVEPERLMGEQEPDAALFVLMLPSLNPTRA